MTNDTQGYDIATIREFLLAAFTVDEFRRFCHERPDFRLVVRRFGPRHSLDDMVDELITYCENYFAFPELLAELKHYSPRQYARFFEPEAPQDEPATPAPIEPEMVYVPAGPFWMGTSYAQVQDMRRRFDWAKSYSFDEEQPQTRLNLPAFEIGRYLVTNAEYAVFAEATGHLAPAYFADGHCPENRANHPVVNRAWEDAQNYVAWLGECTGRPYRLPTEAEWEKAARGTDGRLWPWGNEPPDEERCTFRTRHGPTPVGRYSPAGDSPYGCADMAGNVWEWCQSLYSPYPYRPDDGREALYRSGGRVLRGGGSGNEPLFLRCASRPVSFPVLGCSFGFRVARGPLG
jgi:formylglycine-generating enzyme required for sulfatase activity